MSRYPGATWRPLAADPSHQALMIRHDGIVLHTMAGSLAGTEAMFLQSGFTGTESHFGVGADGTILQWVDTSRRADANLNGTWRLLSVETADTGPPFPSWSASNVPAWTEAQLDAIAGIVAWAAKEHDFPIKAMRSSRAGERGVGWHRLGIEPWRVDGGEAWSESTGKACPGDRRIAQVPEVIRRAKAIAGGGDDLPEPAALLAAEVTKDVSLKQAVRETHRDVVALKHAFKEFRDNELSRDKNRADGAAASTKQVLAAIDAIEMPEQMTKQELRSITREVVQTELTRTEVP
ncbi:MAG: N-acetylmuramoyl-L-alanine amidase [Actinomycetota bacterium]|nr:N-acetylmuramoyl-L-alanine amidase [Actinomycetota bacterium]